MGQDISTAFNPPPLSLRQCFIDDKFSLPHYLIYRRRRNAANQRFQNMISLLNQRKKRKFDDLDQWTSSSLSSYVHTRTVKKHRLMVRSESGDLREILPKDTLWYLLYVQSPLQNNRLKKMFRIRFRIPYCFFNELSHDISNHELFSRWKFSDAVGSPPSNLKLLLLGSLRYIGRSWTFDDIYEANGISREVNRNFFAAFIDYGSSVMYKKYVIDVAASIDIANHEKLFSLAGMPGCIGSGDGTHIIMLNCPSWATNSHKGFKLNLPARTYNLTVSHTKLILGSTTGHPSTWNDKTLVLYDPLIAGVRDGTKYDDFEFTLYEKRHNGDIVEAKYKGVWFMVDNGYLDWSCTVPPVKDATTYQTIRFSEWLESMRKDVECTFGILKQRFSILRHGVRLSHIKNVDEIWLTCCALHNKLLIMDGLHEDWGVGESSNAESNSTTNTNVSNTQTPFSVNRLNRNFPDNLQHDPNSIIHSSLFDEYTIDGKRIIQKMPLKIFRQCLINHFDICFQMKSIKWPSKKKNTPSLI